MAISRFKRVIGWGTVILAVLLVAAIFGWSRLRAVSSTALPMVQAGSKPRTAQVHRGEIVKQLVIDGELRAVRSRTVYSTASGEAKIVYLAPEGSLVKEGDKVAELDNSAVLNKIKDLTERLVSADSETVQTRSTQESDLREMEVTLSRLWLAVEQAKIKARIPPEVQIRRDYQENQLALSKANTEYESQIRKIEQKKKQNAAELQVKLLEKEKMTTQLNQAKADLGSMEMRATSAGMVLYSDHWNERRKIQVGDLVWGGFPLVSLPDLTEMEVVAPVNEVDGPKLSVGMRARISLDSYPQRVITGQVKEIAQTAVKASWNSKAKVFSVVVSLDQTLTGVMKPGMSAQITIEVDRTGQQLLAPRSSVDFSSGYPLVMRIESGEQLRPVAVNIIESNEIYFAVAGNGALKEGDTIVAGWNP